MINNTEDGLERRGRFFAYAPLILWIAVILVLGSGPGSSAQTSRFIRPLIEFFFPGASPDAFLIVHPFIRKAAHFVEYFILAVLAVRTFKGVAGRRRYLASILIVLSIAVIDEAKQSFDPARTGSPWDVLVDLSGGATGLAAFYVVRAGLRALYRSPTGTQGVELNSE